LQGTFEKIGFQCFVRHQPLQLRDLQPQFAFFAVLWWCVAVVNRFDLVAPFITASTGLLPVLWTVR
jgi:hypothetical protein